MPTGARLGKLIHGSLNCATKRCQSSAPLPTAMPYPTTRPTSISVTLIGLGLLWVVSDLRLVFLGKYGKDAYREACSSASARALRDGAAIVWAADPYTARYYGLLVTAANRSSSVDSHGGIDLPVNTRAVDPQGWSRSQARAFLDSSPVPVILVLSKADPYDQKGTWGSLMKERRPREIARLNAFSIYEWQPK
jgi:hypothetical protein